VKIIDFGGATYNTGDNDHIITTETYRAPEVILECQNWDEKSDIWSMGCILIEIYTGEIFYDAEEYIEHLAMIEKQCGPIPEHMARNSTLHYIFTQDYRTIWVGDFEMRVDWPHVRKSNYHSWYDMITLDRLV